MKFSKVFVEKQVANNPKTIEILNRVKSPEVVELDKIEDVFGRVKKPYLQKRDSLQLFIGRKEGDLIKPAPDAYGINEGTHFYFIHAYNCIYECEYCYLQGYFNSPDIVLFVNHDEIVEEMTRVYEANKHKGNVWFHAGEFSDSLALASITNEFEPYWEFFKSHPNAYLELRTKSANVKPIRDLEVLDNIIVSFSMSPEVQIKKFDLKTASLKARLNAIDTLIEKGFTVGLHFDPIIYIDNFQEIYQELMENLSTRIPNKQLKYISLGVVRFSKNSFLEVQRNYPKSELLAEDFIKSFDQKIRYKRPQRHWMLNKLKDICTSFNYDEEKIYFCMENEEN